MKRKPTKVGLTDLSYLTEADAVALSRAIAAGAVTFFALRQCEGENCEKLVPRDHKRFCSKGCYEGIYGKEEDEDV